MYKILDRVQGPEELKQLTSEERQRLVIEIRDFLLKSISSTGGHLASNLGVVELTVALHTVFDSPKDKLLFDVGHQAYVHKLLTGRREDFPTLRQEGGMSGFLKRSESPHDVFEAGHSTTSISAALGFARARHLTGEDYDVVAVIGDGAMTGGMAYEAMNLAGHLGENLNVILNDNEMSIDGNIGSIAHYLERLTTSTPYTRFKESTRKGLTSIPKIGPDLMKPLTKFKDSLKYFMIPGILFEEMGFKYIGPVDGHDLEAVIEHLTLIKNYEKPVLLHVKTTKGKGYRPAEDNPDKYHGVGTFDVRKGIQPNTDKKLSYSDVAGQTLLDLAKADGRVVAITAAMPGGTGLMQLKDTLPNQYIDAGIAEQNAVTMAAGLAAAGARPYVAIYSTFLQRAYDQIIHDVALQQLPVRFLIDRAGIVGQDGETHQGLFDVAFLTHVPHMTVMAPKDGPELERMMREERVAGPLALRYPRGTAIEVAPSMGDLYEPEILRSGKDVALVAVGHMVSPTLEAADLLRVQGIEATVVSARCLKPLPLATLSRIAESHEILITVEDHLLTGGYGQTLAATLDRSIHCIGIDDFFVPHGTQSDLYRSLGLDGPGLANRVLAHLGRLGAGGKRAAR